MRKGMVQGLARPVYYDRNPVSKTSIYSNAAVAPHAGTTRWTYTVPAGKKTFVEAAQVSVLQDTVGTTPGAGTNGISYQPSGGSAGQILQALTHAIALSTYNVVTLAPQMYMGAADILSCITADGMVGGSKQYLGVAAYAEYDA